MSLSAAVLATSPARAADMVMKATATWYGVPYHGNAMKGGERPGCNHGIFNKDNPALAAASGEFAFGTRLRLRYPAKGTSQEVVVCDRGNFGYRHIDVSEAGAVRLGIRRAGKVTLLVTIIN